jgi:hypothetical protein
MQARVLGEVHLTHAAGANPGEDLIGSEAGTHRERYIG